MRTARFAAALALPLVAIAGCSKPVTVDDLQQTVADELNKSYEQSGLGKKVSTVHCPDQMNNSENGKTYVCTADLENNKVRVGVVMEDGSIKSITSLDAVYDLAKLSKDLTDQKTKEVGHPVAVNCGTGLKVVPAGDKFTCEYVDGTTKTTIDVTAKIEATPTGK
ncbi:MAG: DUF4333 domain-containing protein [Nocardiaceae bacterium]|nr:DUF4333 domain-containing protein [Nocardiaceae bacterium]